MIGVVVFALIVGSLIPSGPIASARKDGTQTSVSQPVARGGRGAPANPQAALPVEPLTYTQLISLIETSPASVKKLVLQNGSDSVVIVREGKQDFKLVLPDDGGKQELRALAKSKSVVLEVLPQPEPGANIPAIASVAILFVILVVVLAQVGRRGGAGGGAGGMGRAMGVGASPAKRVDKLGANIPKVTFADVAGCDEAVTELKRVVKGIVGKDVYDAFGAKLPAGILLIGPPGTGKTLLAKAVAGESKGTMDILSGSDFVQMFVGVGAARVRDLFANARKTVAETKRPHIIFIDEIDAVGGKRGGGAAKSSHEEREQTLNQLLVEMDGVQSNEGIIVMAATNRVDMLDDALLRPGRFDCHVSVDLPDKVGREKIFAIHLRKKPIAPDVTLATLAARTYGYSGAEIEGACNRAAIMGAERWAVQAKALTDGGTPAAELPTVLPKQILLTEFDEAIDFVKYGGANVSSQARMPVEEKKNTAIHEAGHACAGAVLEGCDPVVKITIMRRSKALGYVQYMPDTDRFSFTLKQAVSRIVSSLAGRAAQEVLLDTIDTGASNDFEQANRLARQMVTRWGMSTLGHIFVGEAGPSIGRGGSGGDIGFGSALADKVDAEVQRIVSACYGIAKTIVAKDRKRLEAVAALLLEKETILIDEWKALLERIPTAVEKTDVAFDPTAKPEEIGGVA